ncbi:hypothetical protein F4703DRAFT_1919845, partial [Phycomyces blakesleeanus]
MNPNDVHNIAVRYCYQFICQGDPVLPENSTINDDIIRQKFVGLCQLLRDILDNRVILKTLSEAPGRFTHLQPCLFSLIESKHNSHCEYDVKRLPLPQIFSVFPTLSLHRRSLTLSVNTLSVSLL